MVLYHLLSSHLHVGPRNGAQDWKHRAAMPSEIAVAKIKLALGRDHRDTSHQSTATHRTSVCSRGPRSRAAHRIPGAAGVRGPTKSERTEHPKPTGMETPQSPLPSQGPRSRHSSSKSQLLFANLFSFFKKKTERRGAQWSGDESKGSRSTARVGFVHLLPPPSGSRRTPLGPGRDTHCGRMTFEAGGRRSSPRAWMTASAALFQPEASVSILTAQLRSRKQPKG